MIRRAQLDHLEAALSPPAAICLWLEEAHAFGSYFAYEAWAIDQPRAAHPIARIPAQVRADVERRLHGQPRAAVEAAARRADRDAVFRVALVHDLNEATSANLQVWTLEWQLFTCLVLVVELGDEDGPFAGSTRRRTDPVELAAHRANLVSGIAGHVIGILTAQEAHHILERHYLGGHAALFPDLAAEEEQVIALATRLAENVRELATCWSPGRRPGQTRGRGPDLRLSALRKAAHAQAPGAAARRLEAARMRAFDYLGEYANAAVVARRIIRTLSSGPRTS